MKLTVKTLKGNKFEVEVDDSKLVSDVKTIIVRITFLLLAFRLFVCLFVFVFSFAYLFCLFVCVVSF